MKPLASLSLDLDNKWSYMKIHGDAGWDLYPTYLPTVVPRVLEILERLDLDITFFIVGKDATRPENITALRSLADAGHEIGSHSHHHEPWLHLYTPAEIETELATAEAAIEAATGQRPRGFRGPGFSVSNDVLQCLQRRGYVYDASTFPTYLGPVARAYYFMTSKLPAEERAKRKELFGKLSEGLRPLKPYAWTLDGGELLEIPVTTIPGAKVPFHLSYVLYLAGYSRALAISYFRTALAACRVAGVEPSLLLHPLDFLGGDDAPELAFFPAMQMTGAVKSALSAELLAIYAHQFDVVPMLAHAEAITKRGRHRRRVPAFAKGSAPRGAADATASRS